MNAMNKYEQYREYELNLAHIHSLTLSPYLYTTLERLYVSWKLNGACCLLVVWSVITSVLTSLTNVSFEISRFWKWLSVAWNREFIKSVARLSELFLKALKDILLNFIFIGIITVSTINALKRTEAEAWSGALDSSPSEAMLRMLEILTCRINA